MKSAFRRLLTLGRDTTAATAVEFAMLVTPLIVLILASLQLAIIFYAGQVLQSAAVYASRDLMTGTVQGASPAVTAANFKTNYVCSNADANENINFLFNCNNVMVDVESYSAYSGMTTTPITLTYNGSGAVTNNFSYSTGSPGDILILRVMYNWPVVGSPLLPGIANQPNGQHLLIATSVFKTEPY